MVNRVIEGDIYEYKFSFGQSDVVKFAEASGDYNPVHLDNDYARETIFKRTIIHGFLGGSVFSKVFGTMFPGPGTIYLKQDMKFFKPMYTDVEYTAVLKVVSTDKERNRAIVETLIEDNEGQFTIKGEAVIQHQSIF